MSAWYVLSALGFYQVNPSDPVYAIGTPLFEEAKIHLENGRTFEIRAPGVSPEKFYIAGARLNGRPLRRSYLTHGEIMNGGRLEFEMTDAPVRNWFTEAPVSKVALDFPSVPTIEGERVFEESTEVTISTPEPGVRIFYTLDGSEPDETSRKYERPLKITGSTTVRAVSVNARGVKSPVAGSRLDRMPNDWDVKLLSTYNRQYTGGGPKGLIDGLRGTTNFASGQWQGYQDQDFVAVIDLKRETPIRRLGGGFLQVARSWIWMPTKIVFEVSRDGENFTPAAEIVTGFPEREMEHTIRDYIAELPEPVRARYVRVTATNLGTIPDWHPGAGYQAFIFVDEIFIR